LIWVLQVQQASPSQIVVVEKKELQLMGLL